MKKLLFFLILIHAAIFISCKKEQTPHDCPFDLCPYKGFVSFPGLIATGETMPDPEFEGTDTEAIDAMHFIYPAASYDELDSILFTPKP
jgi:membrane-associated PAP2 superfamily phosphatase